MTSKSISAILWTLVSVNVITLVFGGLITWLGYAIPVRLTQFGLLPELVIIAGFASLVVACIGLCALNYSSHLALNVYGTSCTVFALMLVLGLPESWYKSQHFGAGSLLMDMIYYALLFILLVLLVFAFTFAQYLRREELMCESVDAFADSGYNSPTCTCSAKSVAIPALAPVSASLAPMAAQQLQLECANCEDQFNRSLLMDKWQPRTLSRMNVGQSGSNDLHDINTCFSEPGQREQQEQQQHRRLAQADIVSALGRRQRSEANIYESSSSLNNAKQLDHSHHHHHHHHHLSLNYGSRNRSWSRSRSRGKNMHNQISQQANCRSNGSLARQTGLLRERRELMDQYAPLIHLAIRSRAPDLAQAEDYPPGHAHSRNAAECPACPQAQVQYT